LENKQTGVQFSHAVPFKKLRSCRTSRQELGDKRALAKTQQKCGILTRRKIQYGENPGDSAHSLRVTYIRKPNSGWLGAKGWKENADELGMTTRGLAVSR
jgi:hypothetical protein